MRVSVHGGLCIRLIPELGLVVSEILWPTLEHVSTSSSVRDKRIDVSRLRRLILEAAK